MRPGDINDVPRGQIVISGTAEDYAKCPDLILMDGEMSLEKQPDGRYKIKVGDGLTKWSKLPYVGKEPASAEINDVGHLVLYYDDGSFQDCGVIEISDAFSGGALSSDIPVTVDTFAGIPKNSTYPAGTSFETIFRDLLNPYSPPTVSLTINPTTEVYDVVSETLSQITINAKVVKTSKEIASVKFYIDGVEQRSITTGVANGGTFTYTHTFSPATKTSFAIKVTVNDTKQNVTATKNIVFIGKSYYGIVNGEDLTTPTITDVKALANTVVKNSRNLIYQNINITYGKVLYAYPKSLGAITKILDADGRDWIASYTRSELIIDGIEYYAYLLTDAIGVTNAYQKFQ